MPELRKCFCGFETTRTGMHNHIKKAHSIEFAKVKLSATDELSTFVKMISEEEWKYHQLVHAFPSVKHKRIAVIFDFASDRFDLDKVTVDTVTEILKKQGLINSKNPPCTVTILKENSSV